MADFTNIPTGLKITSQIPLNTKEYIANEATLAYLGVNDNLAFTYHDGIEILCIEEKTLYKWREVQVGEENTGLVPLDYTYPNGLPDTFGINYSGKTYNFFLVDYVTSEDIESYLETFVNLENVGEGAKIYKEGTRFDLKTIVSDTLEIEEEANEIRINTPTSTSNLSFYVDENSTASSETGTIAAPFKNINKALDAFIGTGTWYNPQYKGYKITLLSNCTLLEVAGVNYNGYVNLDINDLNIEGNGFTIGLYANPSADYYPISTRRMVDAMPKTANILDYNITIRFNNILFQRTGTNAIVDNLQYAFPAVTFAGAFSPEQKGVSLWITNCSLFNSTNKDLSGNFETIPNPNDGGNPLLFYGRTVFVSNTEPWGVPMVKSEGRDWNKEGSFRLGNCRLVGSTGPVFKGVNTTFNDFNDFSIWGMDSYYRLYEENVDDHYTPRLGTYMIELEDVNYFQLNNLRLNWTIPRMTTTEAIPTNRIIGGVEALFKLKNSFLNVIGKSSDQDQCVNLVQMDGDSTVEFDGYRNDGQIADTVHGTFKVITPLPSFPKNISIINSYLKNVITDETGADKSYIQQINGVANNINNAPHNFYLQYANDVDAKAAGLIKGNVYYNTTIGGLKTVI